METLAFFAGGGITLMLNANLRRANGPVAGATEIVLSADSVTSRFTEFKQSGCSFINEPREVTPSSWAATFTDPDGHWLTLFGPQ